MRFDWTLEYIFAWNKEYNCCPSHVEKYWNLTKVQYKEVERLQGLVNVEVGFWLHHLKVKTSGYMRGLPVKIIIFLLQFTGLVQKFRNLFHLFELKSEKLHQIVLEMVTRNWDKKLLHRLVHDAFNPDFSQSLLSNWLCSCITYLLKHHWNLWTNKIAGCVHYIRKKQSLNIVYCVREMLRDVSCNVTCCGVRIFAIIQIKTLSLYVWKHIWKF